MLIPGLIKSFTNCIDLVAEGFNCCLVFVALEALYHNLGGKPVSVSEASLT